MVSMNYLIYIISVAVILIVFVVGFNKSRKMAAGYANNMPEQGNPQGEVQHTNRIYEKLGVNQTCEHKLGAIQAIIRGKILFIPFGIMIISIALHGLYTLYFTDMEFFVPRDTLNMTIVTILLVGSILYGLKMINIASFRIKLRKYGFEMSSFLGKKSYQYKDCEFYLFHTIESKQRSDGYTSLIDEANTYQYVWVCQISLKGQAKVIEVKSDRYAKLKRKINDLKNGLVWID